MLHLAKPLAIWSIFIVTISVVYIVTGGDIIMVKIDKSPVNVLLTPTQREIMEQWAEQINPHLPNDQCASKAALIRIMVSELDGKLDDGAFSEFLEKYDVTTDVDRSKVPHEKLEESSVPVKLLEGQKQRLKLWAKATNFFISDIVRILLYEEAGLIKKGYMKTCINSAESGEAIIQYKDYLRA